MHNSCTGIPDVKTMQCYKCQDLAICVLINRSIVSIGQMLKAYEEKVNNGYNDLNESINKLREQQLSIPEQILNGLPKETPIKDELPKFATRDFSPYRQPPIQEDTQQDNEIIDVEIKKGLLEKGKELFGIVRV